MRRDKRPVDYGAITPHWVLDAAIDVSRSKPEPPRLMLTPGLRVMLWFGGLAIFVGLLLLVAFGIVLIAAGLSAIAPLR